MVRSTARLALVVLIGIATGIGACGQETADMAPADFEEFATEYTAAWNSQDPASVATFFAEDGSLTINEGEPSVGRAAITEAAQSFMTAYPDMVVEMDSLGRAGDRITFHWTFTGTNTEPGGAGHPVHVSGYEEWLFGSDGLVADSRGHYDAAEWQRQVEGGAPPPVW